jgi:Tfp pilus assembly protein PilF
VLGYYSWGSNDSSNRRRQFGMKFVPGALAATFVSSDARTFEPPPPDWVPSNDWNNPRALFAGSPQTLIGDLIREGVTGAAGHVSEPYLQNTIRPDILFPAYLAGFNLAEAFYLAMPNLSWQTVVIGDPLCSPFKRPLLTRADIDDGLNSQTELPALFSKRRLETVRTVLKVASEPALTMLLAAEARQARGDTTGTRAALEKATAIDPSIGAAQLQLATIYDSAGEHDKAIERYRIVVKMQPNNVLALNNLAFALGVRKNAPVEALPFAERAAALAPQDANVLDTLGWLKHLNGDSRVAAKLLADAALRAPTVGEIRLHQAFVSAAIGDLAAAQAALAQGLRLDPSLAKRPDVVQLQRTLREKRP